MKRLHDGVQQWVTGENMNEVEIYMRGWKISKIVHMFTRPLKCPKVTQTRLDGNGSIAKTQLQLLDVSTSWNGEGDVEPMNERPWPGTPLKDTGSCCEATRSSGDPIGRKAMRALRQATGSSCHSLVVSPFFFSSLSFPP